MAAHDHNTRRYITPTKLGRIYLRTTHPTKGNARSNAFTTDSRATGAQLRETRNGEHAVRQVSVQCRAIRKEG